jgi:hypothetical protein
MVDVLLFAQSVAFDQGACGPFVDWIGVVKTLEDRRWNRMFCIIAILL